MRRANPDLLLAAGVAALALVVTLLDIGAPVVRAVLGGPLVLVLPGYAVSAAIFPNWRQGRAALLLLSLALSLAVAALGGLLLELTPFGVQAKSWSILLFAITLAGCAIATVRKAGQPVESAPVRDRILVRRSHVVAFGAALVLVSGAMWVARAPAPQAPDQAYSTLWAIPVAGATNVVRVGVVSAEQHTADYIVRVSDGDQQLQEFSIQLAPAAAWETDLEFGGLPTDQSIEVQLFKADSPDVVYRRVTVRGG